MGKIHEDFPFGFHQHHHLRHSCTSAVLDLSSSEAADLAMHKAMRNWKKAQSVVKVSRMSLMPSRMNSKKHSLMTTTRTSSDGHSMASSLPSCTEANESDADAEGL